MIIKKTFKEVEQELITNINCGLTSEEAKKRLEVNGPNSLKEKKKTPLILRFLSQFKDFMVIILLISAIVSCLVSPEEWIESVIIFVVVILNAILGTWQESKAEKSLDALKSLSTPNAKVYRDNELITIKSSEIVVGDIIKIEAGDYVPADARLIEAVSLVVDESALTGESVPVTKNADVIKEDDVSLGDMHNCIFSSTYITYGNGKAIVTKTGMNTEIGKIASSLMDSKKETTPLQIKLDQIGKVIGVICIIICIVVFGLKMFETSDFKDSFVSAIALAVASIPEGLATVVTVVLAIGVEKMVKKHAIVKKLPAVETLGCASVICSDKTGTLTQNKMTIVKYYQNGLHNIEDKLSKEDQKMLEFFSICTDASTKIVDGKRIDIGDPTEIALIVACDKYVKNKIYHKYKRIKDLPFDSERKLMTVVLNYEGKKLVITKGAPDVILSHSINSPIEKNKALDANDKMARDALRVLGVAYKIVDDISNDFNNSEIEQNLNFLGLVGMIDPARPEVKESIALASKAGIKTIMITGDHISTATAIAKELNIYKDGDIALSSSDLSKLSDEELEQNIEKYSVYARVAPEDKVRIVKAWQNKGNVVAMTGDGVNDSPALKKADIGCAMGITGTDVAKEAADVVLVDDNFQTIVSAVKQGRGIYSNIKKVVKYLLSSNIGEVLTIFLASVLSLFGKFDFGVPLFAIHLLWVNLITDSLPAFALGTEDPEDDIMNDKPRSKNEGFFANGMGITIVLEGIMIGLLTLIAYMIGHFLSPDTYLGQTMAFITLSTSQLFHSFNTKSEHTIFTKKLFSNKYLIGSFLIGVGLQICICYIPAFANLFKVVPLSFEYFIICIGLSASTILIVELAKLIKKIIKKVKEK